MLIYGTFASGQRLTFRAAVRDCLADNCFFRGFDGRQN
jgi:hypothetical protein